MNIKANNLFADMQAMAMQARNVGNAADMPAMPNTGAISPAGEVNSSQTNFSSLLKSAIDNVNSVQKEAGVLKTAVEMGDRNVSMAEAMIASQKAGIAFEATVQVRNKLLESYKEIMSMPV
jgi:flagellar hook-basal body complex protein FliE